MMEIERKKIFSKVFKLFVLGVSRTLLLTFIPSNKLSYQELLTISIAMSTIYWLVDYFNI
jgi:uncharacterized membrane protein